MSPYQTDLIKDLYSCPYNVVKIVGIDYFNPVNYFNLISYIVNLFKLVLYRHLFLSDLSFYSNNSCRIVLFNLFIRRIYTRIILIVSFHSRYMVNYIVVYTNLTLPIDLVHYSNLLVCSHVNY